MPPAATAVVKIASMVTAQSVPAEVPKVNAVAPKTTEKAAPTSIASATQVTAPATQAKDAKTPGATQTGTGTAQKPTPTLTNAAASETASNDKPSDFDKWSDKKQNAWLVEQWRKGNLR